MEQHRPSGDNKGATEAGRFADTLWSIVFRAGCTDAVGRTAALEQLCRAYWYPIYAFLRRRGHAPADAQDLTQGFFAYFLERNLCGEAMPHKGRFRTFLVTTLINFVRNAQRRDQAQKRGGPAGALSLDVAQAEGCYALEPADDTTPERLFDRHWALEVLQQAIDRLETDCRQAGRLEEFNAYQAFLTDTGEADYAGLAEQLHKPEGALRTAVCRLRRQFRESIRQVVADTLADPAEVDDELQHLKAILRGD
ncbi:MAG: sigma-70 family RNA polymerase sigma factor [Verrucomicrobia bacterium]|nr:sigma-70 family RNA polymerase sigma factor [Verrucomicrobiota bacterium]